MEAGKQFSSLLEPHPHFCLCSVRDEQRLNHDLNKLTKAGIKMISWYEPDFRGELTAIVSEPISGEKRKLFRNFQLLKGEDKICKEVTKDVNS